ncbi:hypothetical protein [Lacinutrix jangbogonensis]|uniref:hypothetical protein n=1 Tax=Lacinutrix jangbogonensis TaxID=1469557 RepID=UPI00053EDEFC|nr:hypothetical protein [Lacinutrix jangbogonensis]
MKKFILLFSLFTFSTFTFAQETYTVENETLELKTEVDGALDLLWNSFNGEYRYFIKSEDEQVFELKNTKGADNKYQEDYKTLLADLTSMDASKVNLTTYSIKSFIDTYNSSKDSNYESRDSKSKVKLRLGVFGGITNNPFNTNPNNEKVALFGTELEAVSSNLDSKHAGFLNVRYTADKDDFQYSATQLALGYRYRFINKANFNIYAQTKFATFTSSKITTTIVDLNDPTTSITEEQSSTSFDAPFIFGLGADIKLGNGYLTLVYDSLFALLLDNEDNFAVDFAIGYKFNL